MPTFDFECAKCKAVFEFSRPFGSKENPPCPACKGKKTEKVFSPPTIVFKGDGWYKTDSRKVQKVEKGTKGEKVSETVKESKAPETKPDQLSKGSAS